MYSIMTQALHLPTLYSTEISASAHSVLCGTCAWPRVILAVWPRNHNRTLSCEHTYTAAGCHLVQLIEYIHIPGDTAAQPMAHHQVSSLAHGMSPQDNFSSPQTPTQHSVLSKWSHAVCHHIRACPCMD